MAYDERPPRYRVRELTFEGTLHSAEDIRTYGSGQGHFRNIVLKTSGMFGYDAYVPVTLFGLDAAELDPARDKDRQMTVTASLQTSQYHDRNGVLRWSVSLAASAVALGPVRPVPALPAETGHQENQTVLADDPGVADDIPF